MGYRYTPDLNVLIQSRLLFYMLQNVHLHGCEVQRLEIYVALGGESDLAVPPWASLESSSPQLPPPPPWRPTFPGLSINFEGWGKGVAWPTLPLPPYYTDYSVAHFLPGFTCVRVVCQVSPNNVKYSFISYTHQPIPVWITFSIMYGEGSGDVQ